MSGTKAGGAKAAKTNISRYGKDFYRKIGSKGGQKATNGGFASLKVGPDGLTGLQRAKIAGAKGGAKSSRAGVKNGKGENKQPKNYIYRGGEDDV